jgi:hypothetical protein
MKNSMVVSQEITISIFILSNILTYTSKRSESRKGNFFVVAVEGFELWA